MKGLGKRQKKDRSRARVVRARVVRARVVGARFVRASPYVEHSQPFHSALIDGVAFHAKDDGPCSCFGDSVRWIALPYTRAQLLEV